MNGWFVRCVRAQEEIIWGEEMRARHNSGSGVVVLEEIVVQIGLIITGY